MSVTASCGLVVAMTLLTPQLGAFQQVKLRGTVRDQTSHKAIPRAAVTASGNQSKQDEVTDDQGFFRLVLEGIAPGALVRIRVQKEGYTPYDRNMAVSEEIPIEILMSPAPTHVAPTPNEISPVEAHFMNQLKSPDARVRVSAIESLSRISPMTSGAAAAIAGGLLDANVDVQLQALYATRRLRLNSKEAVTNLIIAMSDSHDHGTGMRLRAIAALALGEIGPPARVAIPALLTAMSDPDRSTAQESNAALSLVRLGVIDPKVDASLIKYIGDSEYAGRALLEMGPEARRFVPGLIGQLHAVLQSGRQETRTEVTIVRVLERIGPSGEAGLSELMASLTALGQARLAMAWTEVNPAAGPAVLRAMKGDEASVLLTEKLASDHDEDLCLPEDWQCWQQPHSMSLRAAAVILRLGLESREQAWKVILGVLSREDPGREYAQRVAYATFVAGELDPAFARQAMPALVKLLGQCTKVFGEESARKNLLPRLARVIGKIGDKTAVPPLEAIVRGTDSDPTREAAKQALAAIQSLQ